MNNLITQYINKITINNINDFALKNNIHLNETELNVIYDVTKNHYNDLLAGNDAQIMEHLKRSLSPVNFEKITTLYNEYRIKFSGYL